MRRTRCMLIALSFILFVPLSVQAKELIPGGELIGLHLRDGSVTIADFDGQRGELARNCGLKIGDEITRINGCPIHTPSDVPAAVNTGQGKADVCYRRGSKTGTVTLQAAPGEKLGLCLRQGIAGVGTVTWYDPQSGCFGTLGHGVSNDKGLLLQLTQGDVYHAQVSGIQKGKAGQPGALKGAATSDIPFGSLGMNRPQGVFGRCSQIPAGQLLPCAQWPQLHTGKAAIRSTVCGEFPKAYSVEIVKLYDSRSDGRDMLLRVTDPELLNTVGGIVQGMSGSPIIQDGRIVGAVTHVLVADSAMGYGIFIGNMLDAAENYESIS